MVQNFMDQLATAFTEFTSATELGIALSKISGNESFSPNQYSDVGFRPEFQDHTGPEFTENQVRHSVGGLIAGYLWGDNRLSRRAMDARENMSLPTGQADTRLNRVTMPMGAQLSGPNGGSRAAGLADWIRRTLCDPLRR